MNLVVDVMEGDRFTVCQGDVLQYRNNQFRRINFRSIGELWCDASAFENEHPIYLPVFTRYCQGCGLTVKEVKPDPQVETIKPPEWGVVWPDGSIMLMENEGKASSVVDKHATREFKAKPVRIDWGAK